VIGLGIVVWVLESVPVALFVARMIRLRDQREQGLVDFGSDGAIPVRRGLLGDGIAALALSLNDPPEVIAGQVDGPADRGLCSHTVVQHFEALAARIRAATAAFSSHRNTASPTVRSDDAALDAIATVRAEQRCEALLLYLILTAKTKR
jgi:hypothetical protein